MSDEHCDFLLLWGSVSEESIVVAMVVKSMDESIHKDHLGETEFTTLKSCKVRAFI